MPFFGAHMSIAGGYHNALLTAQKYGCQAVQIFTKNNNQWRAKPLTEEDIRLFKRHLRASGIKQPLAHISYLINLAAPAEELFRLSVDAAVIEMERAEALSLAYLVMHPGTATDGDFRSGVQRIVRGIDEIHRRCQGFRVRILLETTAGQGNSIGHTFDQLADIIGQAKDADRLGVCLDTCHVFAAGYPLAPQAAYDTTFAQFDDRIGLKKLKAFHVNDSKKPLGSRVDRHAHIGQGCLGLEPFRLLVNDARFRRHPMVLETPKESPEGVDLDALNLKTLRDLVCP